MTCLTTWTGEVGMASLVENDLLAPALGTENPNLRTEVSDTINSNTMM